MNFIHRFSNSNNISLKSIPLHDEEDEEKEVVDRTVPNMIRTVMPSSPTKHPSIDISKDAPSHPEQNPIRSFFQRLEHSKSSLFFSEDDNKTLDTKKSEDSHSTNHVHQHQNCYYEELDGYSMPQSMMEGYSPPPVHQGQPRRRQQREEQEVELQDDEDVQSLSSSITSISTSIPLQLEFPKNGRAGTTNHNHHDPRSKLALLMKKLLPDDRSIRSSSSLFLPEHNNTQINRHDDDGEVSPPPTIQDYRELETSMIETKFQLANTQADLDRALARLHRAEQERDLLRNKYSALQFSTAHREATIQDTPPSSLDSSSLDSSSRLVPPRMSLESSSRFPNDANNSQVLWE